MSRQERKTMIRRLAPWAACVAMVALVATATGQWDAWTSRRTVQTTQNAFVESDAAILSARVSGYVRALPVGDYQPVKAGELVARIDDGDAQAQVSAARASLNRAQASLDNLDAELAQQKAGVAQERARLSAAQVRVRQYRRDPARQADLVREGALSRQLFERAQAELDHAVSLRDAAQAQLELAGKTLEVLQGQRSLRQADVEAAQAALELAQRELEHTRLVAPFDGVLGRRHVQLGGLVSPGTQVVSIVPSGQAYVMANYKETQLAHVRRGQPVEIAVDALPGRRFRGRVGELAPMSGAKSALLPADNASGNFTKVVQRIPVRIELEPGQEGLDSLRPGMSVETRIDTRGDVVPDYQGSLAQAAAGGRR